MNYPTGTRPQSVAVGDFNNDTRLDIVVANYGSNDVTVLLGYGNGSFGKHMIYSAGSGSGSLAVGDFNNNSRLDIVVANYYSNNISVLLQHNRVILVNETTLASGGGARLRYVAVGDVNNDTQLDIVVANYGTNTVGVLLGYGNGTFINQMMLSTGSNSHPAFIVIGDYNGDTQLDIAAGNSGSKNVDILLGNGQGTFTIQTSNGIRFISTPSIATSGDFNNDEQSEIVVAYDDSDTVDVLVAYNVGSFTNQMKYSTDYGPYSVAIADFNNDTRLDIVVVNSGSNDVSVLLGYGNGSFANQMTYSTGSYPTSVAIVDLNNDTRLDIVVANYGSNDVSILLGHGNGSFANKLTYSAGSYPFSVAVGDFNNDTRVDIVVANSYGNDVSVFLGYGNGAFTNQIKYATGSSPSSVVVADFNNDTRLDIVTANWDSNDASILLGYGNGSFANQMTYATGSNPYSVAVGDFNNDTRLDIIIVNYGSSDVSVLLGYGNGSVTNQTTYSTGSGSDPSSVVVGDFNNDTLLDIVVVNYGTNDVSIFLGFGNGSFRNQMTYSTGASPSSVAIDDFNNDSQLDIVVANYGSNDISLLLGHSNTVFINEMTLITGNGCRPRSFAVGDFNNDDRMDIAIANSGTHNIGILLGYGNISFTNQVTYSTGPSSSPYSIAVCDFNNDSRLDIVVANYGSDNVGIFLGYGNGSFTNQTTYSSGSNSDPYSVAVDDFNNDTIPDIVVANHGTNNLGVFLGYGNGTFTSFISFSLDYGSNPFFVVTGDFNNDRKVDLAVANDGTDSLNILLQSC
ncbi:unnamed protein product [Rotaria sp. Silwood2]|nr:unnamed protein product [Rotaria sp. Silwood2]